MHPGRGYNELKVVSDIWLVDVKRALATRFTFVNSEHSRAMISPDGRQVVFVSSREGRESLFIKPVNGATEERRLFDSGALFTKIESWMPDGRGLVFNTLTRETGIDLWLYLLEGDSAPKQLLATLLPRYVEIAIYRAVLESAAAEHAARMTAMEAATTNASEVIDKLTLYMNRVRQASITKEIA